MKETLYIGIDLGDRSFSMEAVRGSSNSNIPIKLPGQEGTMPILCAVGVRKNGECELLRPQADYDPKAYANILVNFKRQPTSISSSSQEMQEYAFGVKSVLQLTLTHPATKQAIRDLAKECGEIVFCIGYPTNWDKADAEILKGIVDESVLGNESRRSQLFGKPSRVILERESTAAFIYTRIHRYEFGVEQAMQVLALDFGSSTINITALTIGGSETLYNSGHNFFGGRMIDCLIADYYLRQLTPADRARIRDLDIHNHSAATGLILLESCAAKERLVGKQSIRMESDFVGKSVKITQETFQALLDAPLAPAIKQFHLIPESQRTAFGNLSWRQLLTRFLEKEQAKLAKKNLKPEMVIVTGGGSLLPEVRAICMKLFSDGSKSSKTRANQLANVCFLDASDATSTISRGLALAAKRIDQSADFNRNVDQFLDKKLICLIKAEVPSLARDTSGEIADYICDDIIIPTMINWREGYFDTLDDATGHIKRVCADSDFTKKIEKNQQVQNSIKKWSVDKLGNSVARELTSICRAYGVNGFTMDTLNVMKTPSISVDPTVMLGGIYDLLGTLASLIAGYIALTLSPVIVALVLEIIAIFLPGLAAAIFEIICLIPGGPLFLAGAIGYAGFRILRENWDAVRDDALQAVSHLNIPVLFRKAVTENKIKTSIHAKRDEISRKIENSITSGENADNIAWQIKDSVFRQIALKINDIRYVRETQ